MLIVLCGRIEWAEDWDEVPSWPLDPNASSDEYNLHALAEYLGHDKDAYDALRFEALELIERPDVPDTPRRGHGDVELLPEVR